MESPEGWEGIIYIGTPFAWPPNSNLANLVIYGVFIKQSTFSHINGHPKQYILVDTIFNYRFHFGLPGKRLYLSPQNTHLCAPACIFRTFLKTCSWKSKNGFGWLGCVGTHDQNIPTLLSIHQGWTRSQAFVCGRKFVKKDILEQQKKTCPRLTIEHIY